MRKFLFVFFALALSLLGNERFSYGDRGSIPMDPGVPIFEPSQKALIAWNGKEEVLLLTTDMHASQDVEVLEVLPLPAEPEVKKGDLKSFQRASELIYKKLQVEAFHKTRSKDGMSKREQGPAGEVTFHQRIGAHEIFVTRVLDEDRFCQWVYNFLRKKGFSQTRISPEFLKLIGHYLNKKFQWFVFDSISLTKDPRTLDPIQYRFACNYLFYPLKISTLETGRTVIDLIIITPKLLSRFPELPISYVQLRHKPVTIDFQEIRYIHNDLSKLFHPSERVFLRIWRIEGKIQELDKDLVAGE